MIPLLQMVKGWNEGDFKLSKNRILGHDIKKKKKSTKIVFNSCLILKFSKLFTLRLELDTPSLLISYLFETLNVLSHELRYDG